MATYTNNLRLKEITTGDEDGTWGTSTNANLELIADALGYDTQDGFTSDANSSTTVADGTADPARALYFKVTSSATLTATRTLTIGPDTVSRVMFIENATTGSQSIEISQGSGANVTIPTGKSKILYLDGAGATAAVVDITSTAALANLTLASGSTVTSILDEDNMASDSDTALATQQSIKAYVDASGGGASTLADTLTAGNSTGGTNIVVTSGDSITTNTISETTAASGVTVDGLLLKDSSVYVGGTATANKLDDYEEGTFTWTMKDGPSGNSGGLDVAAGAYTKIGNLVTFTGLIYANSISGMTGSQLVLDGLPFTNNGTSFDASAYLGGDATGLAITTGSYISGEIAWLGTYVRLWVWDVSTGNSMMTPSEFSADGYIRISGTYYTTS